MLIWSRYLEEDPSVTVLERHKELEGYEIYVVEQWAVSRSHPTFVITTFTGDPTNKAYVNVLSVPTDESTWSERLRVYFKALNQYHARRRDTTLGALMITHLSGFPSSLTVIPVPDGDLRKHRFDFFVNENLKRMGCAGRVGLSLAQPNSATVAKFHQIYRTSDKVPLYSSVIQLVKLCQIALHLFDRLEIDYADGLLCDITEKAVNDWWFAIGSEFYNIEPHDGILGTSTVVSLLGLLLGARNRLHAINVSVPKDPFDIAAMKKAIGSFQRSQRINKTRRLDRQTLDRLHRASAKAATSEGWSVPRAVKSTVAELSGKGGEMLADVVGRRDKAGIADIETSDLERFYQLIYGERCRWLWHGKPLKTISLDINDSAGVEGRLVLRSDDHGGFTWTGRKDKSDGTFSGRGGADDVPSELANLSSTKENPDDPGNEEEIPHRSVIKRATGLIHDKRSGFGRLKDAVGRRTHHRSNTKDDTPMSPTVDHDKPGLQRSHTSSPTSLISPDGGQERSLDQAIRDKANRPASYRDPIHTDSSQGNTLVQTAAESQQGFIPLGRQSVEGDQDDDDSSSRRQIKRQNTSSTFNTEYTEGSNAENEPPSIAGSMYHGVDLHEVLPEAPNLAQEIGPLLRRTHSYDTFVTHRISKPRSDAFFPRHLSFSLAEDSTTDKAILIAPTEPKNNAPLIEQFVYETTLSSDLKSLRAVIADLDRTEASWTRTQLMALRALLDQADQDIQGIEELYYSPLHFLQDIKDASAGLLRDEKEALGEAGKELETLAARMEYEIGGLTGKIEDVEVGVQDFEHAVTVVEDRVRELEDEAEKGKTRCVVM